MSQVEEIESRVAELSSMELAAFRSWFIEFDASAWDRQFESDVRDGRLDALAENALKDHAAGRSRRLWATMLRRLFGPVITLPPFPSENLLTEHSHCSSSIHGIRRFTSRKSEDSGRPALACAIGPSGLKLRTECSGSGSEPTRNTTA
jgi:hypothetical protein